MYKVTRIMTEDGNEFESPQDAKKYLEKEYSDKLLKLSARAVAIEKHIKMCEFIDENLKEFSELLNLKTEWEEGVIEYE